MRTSFISEHSLEYIIVPRICDILSQEYKNIAPIYYWSTREGSTLSKDLHSSKKLRILSVFPRRPKIEKKDLDFIYGKINYSVMDFTEAAKSLGIPTIFCFPIITSFMDLRNDCKCFWLSVSNYEGDDVQFKVEKRTEEIDFNANQKLKINKLSDDDILKITSEGKELNWDEAIICMNKLRYVNMESAGFWMRLYKPVYILLFE